MGNRRGFIILHEKRRFLQTLVDPGNHPTWLHLQNCSVLRDTDFLQDGPLTGDSNEFVLSHLRYLALPGATSITSPLIQSFLRSNLVVLDISGTTTGDIGVGEPISSTLKILRLNGLLPNDRKRTIKIKSDTLEELEVNGLIHRDSSLVIESAPQLTYLSLQNMASLDDDALDDLLFQKDVHGEFIYTNPEVDAWDHTTERDKKPKFENLKKLNLKGTRVSLPNLRELLPQIDSDKIKKIKERINMGVQEDPEGLLRYVTVNIAHILSARGFFEHFGLFLGNTILGVFWDIRSFGRFIRRLFAAEANLPANVRAHRVNTIAARARGVDTASATAVALRPLDIVAAIPAATAPVRAIPIVGWAISGAFWAGRAAFWEHQRVQHSILLSRILAGMTLREAMKVLEKEKRVTLHLDLHGKHLGDQGLSELFGFTNASENN